MNILLGRLPRKYTYMCGSIRIYLTFLIKGTGLIETFFTENSTLSIWIKITDIV